MLGAEATAVKGPRRPFFLGRGNIVTFPSLGVQPISYHAMRERQADGLELPFNSDGTDTVPDLKCNDLSKQRSALPEPPPTDCG